MMAAAMAVLLPLSLLVAVAHQPEQQQAQQPQQHLLLLQPRLTVNVVPHKEQLQTVLQQLVCVLLVL